MAHYEDGTYAVQFESSLGAMGAGVVTIRDLTVAGGDSGFLFSGRFEEAPSGIEAVISVRQHNPRMPSIFGPLRSFELLIRGAFVGPIGSFSGHVIGQPQLKLAVHLMRQTLAAE